MTFVPNNDLLRKELETLSIEELISRLEVLDKEKLASLNESDRKNPRRLIRAIEISQSKTVPQKKQSLGPLNTMLIVLSGSIDFLAQKINARPRGDLEKEVKNIVSQGFGFDLQSMSALVYREFENPRPIEEIISRWNVLDRQYAKKQLTFFKKYFPPNDNTVWISVEKENWNKDVFELVSKWYTAGSEI
jgi:tRNA A37 N6-isopentenylltransferase MiaA